MTLGVKIHTMNLTMKPMQFICGNIVFSEFSKFLSHMSHEFSEKVIKLHCQLCFQYEQCYNTLITEVVLLSTQLDTY